MGYRKWKDSVTSNWRKEFGVRVEYSNDCIDIPRVQKITSVLIFLRVSSLGEIDYNGLSNSPCSIQRLAPTLRLSKMAGT